MKKLVLALVVLAAVASASSVACASQSLFGRMAFVHHQSPSHSHAQHNN